MVSRIDRDEDITKWHKLGRLIKLKRPNKSDAFNPPFNPLGSGLTALRIEARDFSSWIKLYGPLGTIAMGTFGKKSVWKTQVEVLSSPHQLESIDDNVRNNDRDGGGGGGDGPPPWELLLISFSPVSETAFATKMPESSKEIVQLESNRISISVNWPPIIQSKLNKLNCATRLYCFCHYHHCFRSL